MNIVIIILLIAAFFILGRPDYLSDGPVIARMLTYHFFHVSVLHLCINSLAVYSVFDRKRNDNTKVIVASYAIASLTYLICDVACLGFSNVLYAAIGIRTPKLSSSWWTQPTVAVFFVVTFAMLFVPAISGLTHIVALVMGMLAASIKRIRDEIR